MENFIEALKEKYENFKSDIEFYDSEIFIKIPMILVLRYLFREDELICNEFFDQEFHKSNKDLLSDLQ